MAQLLSSCLFYSFQPWFQEFKFSSPIESKLSQRKFALKHKSWEVLSPERLNHKGFIPSEVKGWSNNSIKKNKIDLKKVTVVQSLSHVWLCDLMDCSTLGFPVLHYLPDHRLWCHPTISSAALYHPLFSFCLQSFLAWGSLTELALSIRWPKYCSFSNSPSNEYSELISFRIEWFDLLAVRGPPKSLLQHHSSKASILQCLAAFMVQFSYPYMTTGKTIVLTIQTFVDKVMSLLFNMLFRLVIAFLPRNKCLLISWLQSWSAVILEKIKSVTASTFSPSICHKVRGLDAMIFVFWMLSFKPAFSLSFTLVRMLFSSSLLSAIIVVSSAYLRVLL